MADQKISELTALTGANLADVDAFAVVDTSAVQTKKITYAELKTALDTGTGFVRITGDAMTGALGITQTGSASTIPLSVHSNLNSSLPILELRSTGNSSSTIDLRADGTGDPKIYFDLNGATAFSIGVDNSDGDKFKISGNHQLGTNPRLTIDSSGASTFGGNVTVDGGLSITGVNAKIVIGGQQVFSSARNMTNVGTIASGAITSSGTVTSGGLIGNATNFDIKQNTSDGSDNKRTRIGGGGDVVSSRGAMVEMSGNEHGNGGMLFLHAGHGGSYSQIRSYTSNVERLRIDSNGDISFYNDSAARALYWDSSTSRLGLGVTAPQAELHINDPSGLSAIQLTGGASGADNFQIMQGITGVTNGGFSIYDLDATATRFSIDSAGASTFSGTVTADGFRTGASNTNSNLLARNSSNTAVYIQNAGSGAILDVQSGSMSAGAGASLFKVNNNGSLNLSDGTDLFNIGVTTNRLTIKSTTVDGADDTSILIDAGSAGESSSRGSYIEVHGNETSADAGKVIYQMGNVSGSAHEFRKAGGTTAAVIDSSGVVNIGTSSGTQPSYFNSFLNVQNNGSTSSNASVTITSGSGGFAGLHFGDSDNGRIGQIAYNNADNSLLFTSNNSTRMTLDDSGNLGLGGIPATNTKLLVKAGTNLNLEVENASSNLRLSALNDARSANVGLQFVSSGFEFLTGNVKINNGNLQIKTTGQIEDNGTRLLLRSTGDASGLRFDGSGYTPFKNGAEANGTVDLGHSGGRFKDLHLSNNANVGGNVTAGSSTAGVVTVGSANGFEMQKSGVNGYINQSDSGPIIVRMGSGYSEKLRIDASGRVGLGTPAPVTQLDVVSGGNARMLIHTDVDGGLAHLMFKTDSQNLDSRMKGAIIFKRDDPGTRGTGSLHLCVNGVNSDVNAGIADSKLNIQYDGAVHVRSTAIPSASVSGFMFSSDQFYTSAGNTTNTNTQVRFYNGNGLVGSIQTSGSATAFNTSSDYRLKENVADMTGATTRLKQLKPKRFNWIADSNNTVQDGFLAHEVSSVVPEAVFGTKDAEIQENGDGYQSLDYSKLVPLLVRTIQELEARITALEA